MKNRAIKLVAIFAVLLFGVAAVANATTYTLATQPYAGGEAAGWNAGFSATFELDVTPLSSNGNGSQDELAVVLDSLTDVAAGSTLTAMEGTWAITGSSGFELVSDANIAKYNTYLSSKHSALVTWGTYTNTAYSQAAWPTPTHGGPYTQSDASLSTTGFDTLDGSGVWGRTGSGENFTSFQGSWYTNDAPLSVGSTIADLFVPAGWTPSPTSVLTYQGVLGFSYGGGHTQNAEIVTATPEPATLVLLASGLVGLLAYAWKKRK